MSSQPPLQTRLSQTSKHKLRSHTTWQHIHLPELNHRLSLNLSLPAPQPPSRDPFAAPPDLTNTAPINAIYLGNSMLERLKNTGSSTNLATCKESWNAGVGGDKTANVCYRFSAGLYTLLQKHVGSDIKVWVLATGTNNLTPRRSYNKHDLESYKLLIETCLDIAPRSKVLACDTFFRKDVPDAIVEEGNEMLEGVVREVNRELGEGGEERVVWVEARGLIGKERLVDHVHLDGEGYRIWDGVLWPCVEGVLEEARWEKE